MKTEIIIPLKAISRNAIGAGSYWNYRSTFEEAEQYLHIFGKKQEVHMIGQVDVLIEAYYDTRLQKVMIQSGKRMGQWTNVRPVLPDACNIDDKIIVDVLLRWKKSRSAKYERPVWFLEDDSPAYIRTVSKRVIAAEVDQIVITLTSVA